MSSAPLVSIIIPVYNVEPYLRECLDSVLAQSYTNWECICVNDGSPDNCAVILEEYAQRDGRFRILSKENGGVSSARNEGLNSMQGAYFTFLDADDYYQSDALDHYIQLALRYQAHIVEASLFLFSSDGETHWENWEQQWNTLPNTVFPAGTIPLLMQVKPYAWNALYHRTLWEESSIYFNSTISIGEDFLFKAKLILQLKKIYVQSSHKIYAYRKGRHDSAMQQNRAAVIAANEFHVYKSLIAAWRHAGRWKEVQADLMELLYHSVNNRVLHMPTLPAIARVFAVSLLLFLCLLGAPSITSFILYIKHQKMILRILKKISIYR